MTLPNRLAYVMVVALTAIFHGGLTQKTYGGNVAQARSLPIGASLLIDELTITRVVDYTQADTNHVIYGQDATGGIAIIASTLNMAAFLAGPDAVAGNADDVVPGSRIGISGSAAFYSGQFEVGEIPIPQAWSYQGLAGLPVPVDVSLADMQDGSQVAELNEGKLVRLSGVSFVEEGAFPGYSNHEVTDGVHSTTVRVGTREMPLAGREIPSGAVDLVGILTQYDTTEPYEEGYYLLIAFPSDITLETPGDYDGNGIVELSDHTAWANAYGSTTSTMADGNSDGIVDAADYTAWRDAMAASTGTLSVPEPTSSMLIALGSLAFLRRR